jgi:hypothetical protein
MRRAQREVEGGGKGGDQKWAALLVRGMAMPVMFWPRHERHWPLLDGLVYEKENGLHHWMQELKLYQNAN